MMMKIICVVAHGKNLEIGLHNKLLWHLSEDLKHFKKITLGKTLVMGRKTFDSIGKVLPGREIVVITRNGDWEHAGVKTFSSLKDCLTYYEGKKLSEILIAGGGEIYKQILPLSHEIWASIIDYSGPADTYFPKYNHDFKEVDSLELSNKAIFKVFQRAEVRV